jgi:hypothetical protein
VLVLVLPCPGSEGRQTHLADHQVIRGSVGDERRRQVLGGAADQGGSAEDRTHQGRRGAGQRRRDVLGSALRGKRRASEKLRALSGYVTLFSIP